MIIRNILKVVVVVLSVSFIGMNQGFAQVSLGPEIALPIGDFSTGYNTGFGGTLRYDKTIDENLSWTVSAGYLSFGYKANPAGYSITTSIIPVNGGVKYYFEGSNTGFYGAADLGFFFVNTSASGTTSSSASETKFGLAPGIGYRLQKFDIAGRYNIVSNANFFNIRIAYVFPSK